jgi:16S rRNA (guanine966-N2)-methyltransferase
MRIIGGKFKGRRFDPPADRWPTRPTTDYAKESLFNILNNLLDVEESRCLDLFAGTGSISYELASRGCTDITLVEQFPGCVQFVKKTCQTLGISEMVNIVPTDVFRFLSGTPLPYDFIFADPPYDLPALDTLPNLIFSQNLLCEDGIFILEHGINFDFSHIEQLFDMRKYGQTIFSFFKNS